MLVIGSLAMNHFGVLPEGRRIGDADYIGTMAEFREFKAGMQDQIALCEVQSPTSFHIVTKGGFNIEFEIAFPLSSGLFLLDLAGAMDGVVYADINTQLAIKLSHRYKKNSKFFLKTMRDIQHLRTCGAVVTPELAEWLPHRERETYVYAHPKLNVTSGEFFTGDGVNYVYDHDSIHLAVAICQRERVVRTGGTGVIGQLVSYGKTEIVTYPAYTFYMKDGSEVMTSKEKFFSVPESVRLHGVYEESCVLALERSQIPHGLGKEGGPSARWSFEMALMKVCTSVTSGWFRCYAWESYDKVMALYSELGEDDYIKRFQANQHLLVPYKRGFNGE